MPKDNNIFIDDDFFEKIKCYQQQVNKILELSLPKATTPADNLKSAMRYSVLDGGKRIRATLVYACAELFQPDFFGKMIDDENQCSGVDSAACAVELIHAYSLIHDDLPAMDNDALRRGKPTCHIAYDEATAILAGDALQSLAFDMLSKYEFNAGLQLKLINTLAKAASLSGMIVGQAMDIDAENKTITIEELEKIHHFKTGALIAASVRMGGLLGTASAVNLEKLDLYARAIGLAFQVKDDILDVEGCVEDTGKVQGVDADLNKSTYPSLLGLEGAKIKLQQLHHEATDALDSFGESAKMLRQLSEFIIQRKN